MNRDHLSLFSGIGGLDLAAEWAGFRTVAFVERDKYCQRVLARHWPGVPIFDDVCKVTADALRGGCDDSGNPEKGCLPAGERGAAGAEQQRGRREHRAIAHDPVRGLSLLTGGFPCQPHSVAGKRKASGDERDLWHECARITGEFRPRWAVFENVPGLLSSEGGSFFARVLGDLASMGYRVGWGVWGANDVGALHKRDRVFIVAHLANSGIGRCGGEDGGGMEQPRGAETIGGSEDVADADGQRSQGRDECEWSGAEWLAWKGREPESRIWSVEPPVGRVAHGIPRRVDRLRALGNAVVPQQAYPIFKAIAEIEGINA